MRVNKILCDFKQLESLLNPVNAYNIYSYMRTVINNGDIELIDYNVFGGIKYTDLTGVKFGANNVFFAKTYDYLDFETIDQFLTGFDRNIYAIDQMDTPEGLPNCESTWLLR